MTRSTRLLRRWFAVGSVSWAVALPAATFASAQLHPPAPLYLFALSIYATGSVVCHQLPARSFFVWGRQMPVCARCVGIYVGAAIAVVMFRSARSASRRLQPTLFLAVLPTAATLVFEWTTGITPANWIRAAAGVVLGAAVAALAMDRLAADPEVN